MSRERLFPIPRWQRGVFLCVMIALFAGSLLTRARADSIVTNCELSSLLAALEGGGNVRFAMNCEYVLTNTIFITNDTILNGTGQLVRFSGSNQFRVFTVLPGAKLQGINITIQNGRDRTGGGLFVDTDATVLLTNCIFLNNRAIGTNGQNGARGGNSSGIGGNGRSGGNGTSAYGGAIENRGSLFATNCMFVANTASGGSGGSGGNGGNGSFQGGNGGDGGHGAPASGGAIYNLGNLFATNCTFAGNFSTGGAGGAGGASGAGPFAGRTGTGGAGAMGNGAAIYNLGSFTGFSSTFSENVATSGDSAAAGQDGNANGKDGYDGSHSYGGGIYNANTANAVNCTFFGNKALAGDGGNGGNGDYIGGDGGNGGNATGGNCFNGSGGLFAVTNCTFADGISSNGAPGTAGSGSSPGSTGRDGLARGANVANGTGTFRLMSSILARGSTSIVTTTNITPATTNYLPVNCTPGSTCTNTNVVAASTNITTTTNVVGAAPNAYGTFVDEGHNLSSDATPTFYSTGSRNRLDPKLGTLSTNGGPTRTILLLSGSPAIDAGDDSVTSFLEEDQRGEPRLSGEHVDIGAVEMRAATILTTPVTTETTVSFSFNTDTALNYIVEETASLTAPNWTPIWTNAGTGDLMIVEDLPLSSGTQFFRVRREIISP